MLSVKHLTTGYGGPAVLQDVHIDFAPGQLTTLVGPNGCGKSTLLRVLARLLPPSSGQVLLDAQPIASFSPKAYAKEVSLLPQVRDVPAISVYSLVLHGRFPYLGFPRTPSAKDKAVVEQALEAVGVAGLQGLPVDQLSGGQRQKVYLAMALAQDTGIVLLDEPTTFLDIHHQMELLSLIQALPQQGKTVIMVLHDLSQALRVSDRMVLLSQGQVVEQGEPGALLSSHALEEVFQISIQAHCLGQPPQTHYFFSPKAKTTL